MDICIAPGCRGKTLSRGMCNKHYKRMSTYGSFDLPEKVAKVCSRDDCDFLVRCKGLCSAHYTEWYESEKRVISDERRAKQKEYYDNLADRTWVDVPVEKLCPQCKLVRPESEYYRNIRSKTGLMTYCKFCEDQRVKRHWSQRGGRGHISLNYVARKAGAEGNLPANAREILAGFYGNRCAKCGALDKLQVDHVVSLRNGGANTLANTQLLCQSDNAAKGRRNDDFRDRSKGILIDFINGEYIVEVTTDGKIAS